MKTIVVAVFVKDDLIQKQIDNLLYLDNLDEYHILFVQDNIHQNYVYDNEFYKKKYTNVSDIINKNLKLFVNAKLYKLEENSYPFGTCQKGMDYAFNNLNSEFNIFLEDDVFLSKNALQWFNYIYNNNFLKWEKYKFVTGESIFFNSENMDITPSKKSLNIIKKDIENNKYQKYFHEISNFLTSSIFATTKDIWNTEIREIRGYINGPEKLNDIINKNKWKSIFPIVPFAKDIGMLHDYGWSVAHHGKEKVREIKNVYIMSDDVSAVSEYELLPETIKFHNFYPHKKPDFTT